MAERAVADSVGCQKHFDPRLVWVPFSSDHFHGGVSGGSPAGAAAGIYRMVEALLEVEGDGSPDPIPLTFMGLLAERAGNYSSAADQYRGAMALDRSLNFRVDAGRASRLAGRLDESEAELTEALRLVPGDPRAHLEMALLLEARDDVEGAAEHVSNALAAWENADEDYEPARQAQAKLEELRER